MHRVGFANGIAARSFCRVSGFSGGMWSPSLDMNIQMDVDSSLSAHTEVSLPRLSAMTLKGSSLSARSFPCAMTDAAAVRLGCNSARSV